MNRFIRVKNIIIQEEYIAHAMISDEVDQIFIGMKSGTGLIFLPISESYKPGAKKQQGMHYLSTEEFNSLKAYLMGDFSHGVA